MSTVIGTKTVKWMEVKPNKPPLRFLLSNIVLFLFAEHQVVCLGNSKISFVKFALKEKSGLADRILPIAQFSFIPQRLIIRLSHDIMGPRINKLHCTKFTSIIRCISQLYINITSGQIGIDLSWRRFLSGA